MRIYQVDAFASRPFEGNPAAVCLLEYEAREEFMQNLAAEMNLSETAFLTREGEDFHLRWFTPVQEVDLCGHATLASAHVLWETGVLSPKRVASFRTLSGLLEARKTEDGIEMDFPNEAPEPCDPPPHLLEALGVAPTFVGRNRMDFLVQVASEPEVAEARPDFGLLRRVGSRGVILTSRSSIPNLDFVSRFFAPAFGVDEDPVTGSAHCCLAPFWSALLGKAQMKARQISKRGGNLTVRLEGERVLLTGQAVTVLTCEFRTGIPGEDTVKDKKRYVDRMQAGFNDVCSKIDDLLARIEGDARGGASRICGDLRDRRTQFEARMSELKSSSGDAWSDLKPGLEQAWKELSEAWERARGRFTSSADSP